MHQPSGRAWRRHHLQRLRQKRKNDRNAVFDGRPSRPLHAHIITPCPCSCWMCGNPRRFYGNGWKALTLAERKFRARARMHTHQQGASS